MKKGSKKLIMFNILGELYTWGCGNFGRLGHDSSIDQYVPTLVAGLQGQKVVGVSCGKEDAHTLAVTDDGKVTSNVGIAE